jgi:ParB-like chromosome segregation protein Spo0J
MNIEKIEINKLKAATYNPRQISTKQYKDLKESITKFGLVDPIIVNQYFTENYYVVIGGHQRLKICKELGYKDIGCIILDLNKEQERELNIRLNKNTGTFDMDILANEFDIDQLVDWGFKHIDLDVNIDKIVEDDNSATITIKEDDEIKAQELYNDLKKQGYNVKIK